METKLKIKENWTALKKELKQQLTILSPKEFLNPLSLVKHLEKLFLHHQTCQLNMAEGLKYEFSNKILNKILQALSITIERAFTFMP